MNIEEKKTVDMLTSDSVSILTQKFIKEEERFSQVGEDHRKAYVNSETERKELMENEPTEVVESVMAFWGDMPTVLEPKVTDEQEEVVN